jgi:hypothetical protein
VQIEAIDCSRAVFRGRCGDLIKRFKLATFLRRGTLSHVDYYLIGLCDHISFCHLGTDLHPEKDKQHNEYNLNCYNHHDPPHLPTLAPVCVPSRPPTATSRIMLGYWRRIDRYCRRGRIFGRWRRKVSPPSFATHRADFLGLHLGRVGLHL